MTRVYLEDRRVVCPGVRDGLERCFPPQRLQVFGEGCRETADREMLLVAPWLVPLKRRDSIERAVAAARAVGKGVFWIGEPDTEALHRHLRRLNAARMPDGKIVYFRHCDSDVLGAVIPLLTPSQVALVFGSAKALGFIGGCQDKGIFGRVEVLPEPGPGPIEFEFSQIEALEERARVLSRRNIRDFLRAECPAQTVHLTDDELYQKIVYYEHDGRNLNLPSEKTLAYWIHLNLETNDMASQDETFKMSVKRLPWQPHDFFEKTLLDLFQKYREVCPSRKS